eukprot:Skav217430  [mRNA]  locus=scaffold1729:173494:185624:+ [translate_table: standard]
MGSRFCCSRCGKRVAATPRTGEEDERLEFPIAVAGRIIGSRGHQISEVRARSGAQVKIEKLEEVCRVYLGGKPEQVETARKMINSLVEDGVDKPRPDIAPRNRMDSEETVEIPLSMVGRVIGKGGETVQRLQRESGAKIDVNNQLDPSPVRLIVVGLRSRDTGDVLAMKPLVVGPTQHGTTHVAPQILDRAGCDAQGSC